MHWCQNDAFGLNNVAIFIVHCVNYWSGISLELVKKIVKNISGISAKEIISSMGDSELKEKGDNRRYENFVFFYLIVKTNNKNTYYKKGQKTTFPKLLKIKKMAVRKQEYYTSNKERLQKET